MNEPLSIKVGDVAFPFHWNGTEKTRNSALNILKGSTYPLLKGVNPRVIFDIGSNIGAASIHFALNYPEATVYSFEPASINFSLLRSNASHHKNIKVFQNGIYDEVKTERIWVNAQNPERNSLSDHWAGSASYEEIQLIRLDEFLSENKIEKIDIFKIDTEGCELKILQTIAKYLSVIDGLYLEYHSETDKRAILELLRLNHDIVIDRPVGVESRYVDESLLDDFWNYKEIKVGDKLIVNAQEILTAKHVQTLRDRGILNIKVWTKGMGELICKKKASSSN